MKRTWRVCGIAMSVAAVLTVAGCGSTSTPAIDGVQGVVADGYLKGASVFLDLNGDKIWQPGEPKTITGVGGRYQFNDLAKTDARVAVCPIVVQVTTATINEDNNQTVAKEYYLSAPAGKPEVITPITTMIQNNIETGQTETQAVTAVKAALGVSVDLYKDFVAESKVTSTDRADYIKIYNAAQVVATQIASNLEVIKANAASDSKVHEMLSTAVASVTEQLSTISNLDSVKAATVMHPTEVISLLSGNNTPVATIASTEVNTAIASQKDKIIVQASSNFKDVMTAGTYWFDYEQYGSVRLATDGTSLTETIKYFDFETRSWVDTRPTNWETMTTYNLTSTGWKEATDGAADGKVIFNSDGSATWTSNIDGSSMMVNQVAIDISGKTPNKAFGHYYLPVPQSIVFPEGSKAYRMINTQLSDTFRLESYIYKDQNQVEQESNRLYNYGDDVYATSLGHVIDGDFKIYLDSDLHTYSPENGSVYAKLTADAVSFYSDSYMNTSPTLIGSGTWEDKTLFNQTLRIINIPEAIKTAYGISRLPFLVVRNGYVMKGEYTKAGTVRTSSGYDLNKTAFDFILANAFNYNDTPAKVASKKFSAKSFSKHYFGI